MKKNSANLKVWALAALLIAALMQQGCIGDSNPPPGPEARSEFNFNFNTAGFVGDVSDFTTANEDAINFNLDVGPLPSDANSQGLRLNFTDVGNDVFAYTWIGIDVLEASTFYNITFEITLEVANMAVDDSANGAPDEFVHFKAGATGQLPRRTTDNDFVSVNFDKGADTQSGGDMLYFGTLTLPEAGAATGSFTIENFSVPVFAQTDANGRLYVIFGIEADANLPISVVIDQMNINYAFAG